MNSRNFDVCAKWAVVSCELFAATSLRMKWKQIRERDQRGTVTFCCTDIPTYLEHGNVNFRHLKRRLKM